MTTTSLRQDSTVIGFMGLAHGLSHFFHLVIPSLFPWLKIHFQLSFAELGFLMSLFFIASALAQAAAGFIVDRYGAFRVLISGILLLAFSSLVLAMATHYAMLCLGAMIAGIGNSVFHPADFTILNHKVSTKRLAHAFSFHGIAGSIGWGFAPITLTAIATIHNWQSALYFSSGLAIVLVCLLFFKRNELSTNIHQHKQESNISVTKNLLRSSPVWMCFLFFLITALALGGIQSFTSSSLQILYSISIAQAASAISFYMFLGAIGMLFGGIIATRFTEYHKIITVSFIVAAALSFLLASAWMSSHFAILLVGLIGLISGIAGPSRDLLLRSIAPKGNTGKVYGIVYSGLDAGSAIAPLLFGLLMDINLPAGVFVLVGFLQLLAILPTRRAS